MVHEALMKIMAPGSEKIMKRLWPVVLVCVAAAACNDNSVAVVPECTFAGPLEPQRLSIEPGGTAVVRAHVPGGCPSPTEALAWERSDSAVVAFDQLRDSGDYVVATLRGTKPGKITLSAWLRTDPAMKAVGTVVVQPKSIAGWYGLNVVDGGNLPCCSTTDSAGNTTTIRGGMLYLGPAAADEFVFTPVGYLAKSCVHEIPNGALVDTADVVHLPDGTSYKLPECGAGPYQLTFLLGTQARDGSWTTRDSVISGKYVWGDGFITLVSTRTQRGYPGELTLASNPYETQITLYDNATMPFIDRTRPSHKWGFRWIIVDPAGPGASGARTRAD